MAQNEDITNSNYGKKEFWDGVYADDSAKRDSDWYLNYEAAKTLFEPILKKDHKILIIGCGESDLGFKLYDDGFQDITCIDISDVVVEKMNKAKESRNMKFIAMDASKLTFDAKSFDIIIDKGTLDALLTEMETFSVATDIAKQIKRVLKPDGQFLLFTFAGPEVYQYVLEEEGGLAIKELALEVSFKDAKKIRMYLYLAETLHYIYTILAGVLQWNNKTVCTWLEDNKFG